MITQTEFYGDAEEDAISADKQLYLSSPRVQLITPITSGLSIIMPDATKLKTGAPEYIIYNLDYTGTPTITIKNNGGVAIDTLDSEQVGTCILVDNSTAAGEWKLIIADATTPTAATMDMFVFGGEVSGVRCDAYDPDGDSWSAKTSPSNDHEQSASFILQYDKAYIAGSSNAPHDKFDEYNYDTWTAKEDLPWNFKDGACMEILGKGYAITGTDNTDMAEYSSGSWTIVYEYNYWHNGTSAHGRNSVGYYTLGNHEIDGLTNGHWEWNPSSSAWTQKTDLPSPDRTDHAAFLSSASPATSSEYMVVGGHTATAPDDSVDRYYVSGDSWYAGTAMVMGTRFQGAGITAGGKGYFAGGRTKNGTYTNEEETAEYIIDTWTSKAVMLAADRYICGAAAAV